MKHVLATLLLLGVGSVPLFAAETPSQTGSTVRGPLPGEFSDPGAPSGPGATRRATQEPDLSRPAEPPEKAERTAGIRRKHRPAETSTAKIYPGGSGKALDRDRDRVRNDDQPHGNRVIVNRSHRSR